jgi:pseudaminic acid synthase
MENFRIGRYEIGNGCKPFVIAEMSGNHNQSLDRALAIVDAAAKAGAHAIKLQTYTADTMTLKGAYTIDDPKSLWFGRELHDLYSEAYTPWEWHAPIFERARKSGLEIFSTPFDETSVDFLETLNVPAYKIASFENDDIPLLKKIAATGKPVIMSTGVATTASLDESVRALRDNGCKNLVLLKCTSTYPSTPENTNLKTIPHLRDLFRCHVGLSDHTMGIGVSIASVALGACVIEKHFTLSRAEGGVDSAFSMEPEEMRNLVIESERAFLALGAIQYGVQKVENSFYKRSVYAVKDIEAGEVFSKENLRVIRPALGLAPRYYELLIGRKAHQKIAYGTPLTLDHIL